jgi:hypothetical protein
MAKWIEFYEVPGNGRKTRTWDVRPTADPNTLLGQVKWFGRWRAYAFFPCADTVYERTCLRDLAQFCERQTYEHRSRKEAA